MLVNELMCVMGVVCVLGMMFVMNCVVYWIMCGFGVIECSELLGGVCEFVVWVGVLVVVVV